jgi:hypothetical protein
MQYNLVLVEMLKYAFNVYMYARLIQMFNVNHFIFDLFNLFFYFFFHLKLLSTLLIFIFNSIQLKRMKILIIFFLFE